MLNTVSRRVHKTKKNLRKAQLISSFALIFEDKMNVSVFGFIYERKTKKENKNCVNETVSRNWKQMAKNWNL